VTGLILAAGRNRRFRKETPKFLHRYKGKEIIVRVLEAMRPSVERFVVVTGDFEEDIRRTLAGRGDVTYVRQDEPRGTGHACLVAAAALDGAPESVLVSYSDKPLVTADTFARLACAHADTDADITFTTAMMDPPNSKGRIVREDGRFERIVEASDATGEELAIREVHAGFFCAKPARFFEMLARLTPDNAKNEIYLTDVYAEFRREGLRVETVEIPREESYDVNTVEDLEKIS